MNQATWRHVRDLFPSWNDVSWSPGRRNAWKGGDKGGWGEEPNRNKKRGVLVVVVGSHFFSWILPRARLFTHTGKPYVTYREEG
mmetsp:Transcript_6071/g.14834  ORF Transcript_6071/g.14834 Transcript_6071/m.14834 type:complete len:84 (+) Transcript_6071:3771-4022(+)